MTQEINIGNIGKLILTPRLQEIINYLHMTIGAKEWSGVLFYKITKGNIKNLKDLEFTADFLYPMNIGSSAYTEFEYNGEVMNAYDIYEDGMESSTGMVHTHHNMSTFFSGTDYSELNDNCKNFNYYISLIVNFDGKYRAKIAFPTISETKTKVKCKDSNGVTFIKSFTRNESQILIGDLDIEKQSSHIAPDWLVERHIELVKKNSVTTNRPSIYQSIPPSNKYSPRDFYQDEARDFNSFLNSFDSIEPMKNSLKSTPKEFVSALINLDCDKKNMSIYHSISSIKDITDEELDFFEDAIDANIEIFYNNLFGDKDFVNFNKTCKDSVVELNRYEKSFSENKLFLTIKEILEGYAELEC